MKMDKEVKDKMHSLINLLNNSWEIIVVIIYLYKFFYVKLQINLLFYIDNFYREKVYMLFVHGE